MYLVLRYLIPRNLPGRICLDLDNVLYLLRNFQIFTMTDVVSLNILYNLAPLLGATVCTIY